MKTKRCVMIYFQISIFEPLETAIRRYANVASMLWFAFKLVSLNHWKQQELLIQVQLLVVICFQISIFEPLETAKTSGNNLTNLLWFAFKLVSLNHWKQRSHQLEVRTCVVICFQISIFEPLETARSLFLTLVMELWFAFKLVSLNHWKQP